jgi:hypothetical protein
MRSVKTQKKRSVSVHCEVLTVARCALKQSLAYSNISITQFLPWFSQSNLLLFGHIICSRCLIESRDVFKAKHLSVRNLKTLLLVIH